MFICLPLGPVAVAQTDEDGVRQTVERLFDGMRAGDSTMVRSVIHPAARFVTTALRDGETVLHEGSVEGFIEAVGTEHEEAWDERIGPIMIQIDVPLATAWMDYRFYLGERFSHCGVNAFQLIKTAGEWRVIQITDTRRAEDCGLPEGE